MKIVVTDSKTIADNSAFFEPLKQLGELVLYDLSSPDEVPERIKDADAILCNKTTFSEKEMKNAKNLRYIGLFATGFNNIDLAYARAHGITVCNAGSYSTEAVAQHTFAMILNHFSRIRDYSNFVEADGWKNSKVFSPFRFQLNELNGKSIGLVGYGNIGAAVARIARAFGMNVFVYTRTKKEVDGISFVSFDELLERSDVISVHCPLNPESEKLFDRNAFSKCKPSCYFVNTARGGVVDEEALYEALEDGKIAGAGIDVLTVEPMAKDCILADAKNITFTPHVAWTPVETRERLFHIVYDNLRLFLDGTPQNVVS